MGLVFAKPIYLGKQMAIRITSSLHGIEVAGTRHPISTVHYNDDQFTEEELAAFEASDYLTVDRDEVESAKTDDAEVKTKKDK